MKTVALLLAATVALTGASGAATDYWAFGDSITRGEGSTKTQTFILDPVAGNDCLAIPYPVARCGYHWRLEDTLTSAGIANDVLNRGQAGEGTAFGVSRIDNPGEPLATSRCGDADAGDVLLVMEGTNDMNLLSNTAIKANLGAMIDNATTKCVHSAVASIIRPLAAGTPLGSQQGDWNHAQTSDLATQVNQLASEKSRAYVDVWASLCPNQACYNADYWGRLVPNDPGHVDPDGYTTMASLFAAVITVKPLPGAAVPIAPATDSMDNTPLFSWNAHADSDWYFLEVDGGAGYGRWHPEEQICSAGTCSFQLPSALADGQHTWRVRTRNLRGVGSWSAATSFGVWTGPPNATTLIYPATDVFDTTPVYQWTEVANVTQYDLEVDMSPVSGTPLCTGGLCSLTPMTALGVGLHSWRVQTSNPLFTGPWSSTNNFDVLACTPPPTHDLCGATVGAQLLESACVEIIAGKIAPYTIQGPGGDVTFHAGDQITIHNGFTVDQNARFTAFVDR